MSRKLTPRRKEYLKFQISEKRRQIKLQAIEYKGGKCEKCGYNKCPAALTFHHINPDEKKFGISTEGNNHRNLDSIKSELDKCALLCHNCHAEEHAAHNEKIRQTKKEKLERERVIGPGSSITKRCGNCNKDIKVFKSWNANNNFCDRKCRNEYIHNKGWVP